VFRNRSTDYYNARVIEVRLKVIYRNLSYAYKAKEPGIKVLKGLVLLYYYLIEVNIGVLRLKRVLKDLC
jgi:hypothetical protein